MDLNIYGCVSGVDYRRAIAISDRYPTTAHIMQAYKNYPTVYVYLFIFLCLLSFNNLLYFYHFSPTQMMMLRNIEWGPDRKLIGELLSKRIWSFFFDKTYVDTDATVLTKK